MKVPVKIFFSAQSTGKAVLSQAIGSSVVWENSEPNTVTINVAGDRPMTHTLKTNRWQITDVAVNTTPNPVDVVLTLVHTKTYAQKTSTFNIDLSEDPNATVTVTLSYVTVSAEEYAASSIWVKGPEAEKDQYKNAGQWYYNTNTSQLEIYIP